MRTALLPPSAVVETILKQNDRWYDALLKIV
jgi:hypothetical protein